MKIKGLVFALFTALMLAVSVSQANSQQDAKALAKITERNNEFRQAVIAGDAAAAAAIYHQDVVFQAPDIPTLRGRAAVEAYFQAQIAAGATDIQLVTEEIRPLKALSHGKNLQYEEIGTNLITFMINGQPVQVPGKYIVIWDFPNGVKSLPFIFRDGFSFSVPTP